MNGTAVHLSREQRIVDGLTQALEAQGVAGLIKVKARSQALPAMLRRHGPVQTLLFLAGKSKAEEHGSDGTLAEWLVAGISSALDTTERNLAGEQPGQPATLDRYATWLARQELASYLLRWEAAIEVSGWLKMLIAARTPKENGGQAQIVTETEP